MNAIKRIAVMIDDRQVEGLRMSVGLTLADDELSVFVLAPLDTDDAAVAENLEALQAMGARLYTSKPENPDYMERVTCPGLANVLLGYDHILRY